MKAFAIALLPLAVFAAVIPDAELSRRQVPAPTRGDSWMNSISNWFSSGTSTKHTNDVPAPAGKTWTDTLLSVGGALNKGFQIVNGAAMSYEQLQANLEKQLPAAIQSLVPTIAMFLQWQAKPDKIGSMEAVLMPGQARKAKIRYGPFVLLGQKYNKTNTIPFSMDPKSEIIIRQLKGIPQNAAILSGRMDTVAEDGSKLDVAQGIYIHHLLVADIGKTVAPFAACPGGARTQETIPNFIAYHVVNAVGAGLIQSGNDQVGDANTYYSNKNGLKSAFLTGYDDAFLMESEIVNYNQENTTVYLQLETEYLNEKPEGFMDASTVLFSATGCGSPGYQPKAGQKAYNYTSKPFVMDRDGIIVNNRGHLHDGGVAMQMHLNKKLVCESLPKYGAPPGGAAKSPDGKEWQTILGMSPCLDHIPFKKGDEFTLTSIYDINKHPLREAVGGGAHGEHDSMEGMEEMGIFTANIAIPGSLIPATQQMQQPPAAIAPPAVLKNSTMGGMAGRNKTVAGHSHSRRGAPLQPRYIRQGAPMPEPIWPVAVV